MDAQGKKDRTLIEELCAEIDTVCPAAQAAPLKKLVARLFQYVAPEEFSGRSPKALAHTLLSFRELMAERQRDQLRLQFYTPLEDDDPSRVRRTVIEIVTDDMPFLVDSMRMTLHRHGLSVQMLAHTVIDVRRTTEGKLLEIATGADSRPEAVIFVEIDRHTEADVLERLRADLHGAFADVRAAVTDWPAMRRTLQKILGELATNPPPGLAHEITETRAFLEWVDDHHFTFLGYRQYELVSEQGEDVLRMVPGTALGTAPTTDMPTPSQAFTALPPEQRAHFRERHLLILTKANVRSTVHRPVYMDYIGIKRFNGSGDVIGEHRFLGLYTSAAYNRSPRDIPLLRRKVEAVLVRAGFPRFSHGGKALLNVLETYPRDELFQIGDDELFNNAMRILTLEDRRRAHVFVRREAFGRFVSCLVYVPRDRFDTATRERLQAILLETFAGESVDFTVYISESLLVRVYFIIHTLPGGVPDYEPEELQARVVAAARTWQDELGDTLSTVYGEDIGRPLYTRYAEAFPAAYREDFDPRAATRDIEDIEELSSAAPPVLALYVPRTARAGEFRCKLFATGAAVVLSDVMPMLENLGVRVLRERPYEIRPAKSELLSIYDIALHYEGMDGKLLESVRESFTQTLQATWRGEVENDGFNRLVLSAGLQLAEVIVLRAYAKYLRQLGMPFGQRYFEDTLVRHPEIARDLVDLFHARFDYPAASHAAVARSRLSARLLDALDAVASLDADRILRAFFNAVQATVRTNFAVSPTPPYLVFKLDPKQLPECPAPRPAHEIFVYSTRVEGVHLRGGAVARGGIRWSDRREDFRTEVLDLMKAQMVKNAIIVPVGAKGGFVVKQPLSADRAAVATEVSACYETFIRGLLDVTDNVEDGRIIGPAAITRYDGDDPYLVVAADKGTAAFSDHANAIAADKDFWLGDAFASGGSAGYDHKKMGITARGAWESVKRHFHELGFDPATRAFTVIGIGDMSGDVFGNGMLQSRVIKLVGAFDHRHIFLDPTPDPEKSYVERERLFRLPRSCWADYDAKRISEGGGVYPRHLKSIRLSPPVRQVLGVHAESLTPDALIQAMLRAPVDLLWNGGIGTYVKATAERHTEVGDRGNDNVRINAKELRSNVLAEGGNLGVTQLGRIEYALTGGAINTDFIDNAGGVACSDYEVNIKILLKDLARRGELDEPARRKLLAKMTQEVADLVLSENRWQALALGLMQARNVERLDEHARFIALLERSGRLDRALERLPGEDELAQRRKANAGLTRPELSVLLAYAKNILSEELAAARLSADPAMHPILPRYFPPTLREKAAEAILVHPLRDELIATWLSNRIVNRLGATFVFQTQDELGVSTVAIAKAYLVAWQIFSLPALLHDIETSLQTVPAKALQECLLTVADVTQHAVSWLLRHATGELDVLATVEQYRPAVEYFRQNLAAVASAEQVVEHDRRVQELGEQGFAPAVAKQVIGLPLFYAALDVSEVMRATGVGVAQAAGIYFALERLLDLGWLRERVAGLPANDRWHLRARTALSDDLYVQQRELAIELVRRAGADADAPALIDGWLRSSNGAVERFQQTTADLRKAGSADVSMLTVMVRDLQDLRHPHGAAH